MPFDRRLKIAASVLALLIVCALTTPLFAQGCAMCQTALSGSIEGARAAKKLNYAIVTLLIPPVAMFCGIFFLAYRRRNFFAGNSDRPADSCTGVEANFATQPRELPSERRAAEDGSEEDASSFSFPLKAVVDDSKDTGQRHWVH